MARKRPALELEAPAAPCRQVAKRSKLSPTADVQSNSSVPSSCSVSEASALHSSRGGSDDTARSSFSSLPGSHDEEAQSDVSASSESDDESDLESDTHEDIGTVRGLKKPDIGHLLAGEAPVDLEARLSAFLPQLAEANNALANHTAAGHSMEDVCEDDPHIEMNLGLGVLEERQEGGSSSNSSSSDESSDSEGEKADADAGEVPLSSGAVRREREGREVDVMHKLLGQKRGRRKVGIQDVGSDLRALAAKDDRTTTRLHDVRKRTILEMAPITVTLPPPLKAGSTV